ncbi:MAG TPA: hypothetical protein V6D08_03325 [Candidatus Obscuribacterales bacterium]
MARSYRHSPFHGACADSDKPGKLIANRTLRTRQRMSIKTCRDFDELILPTLREVSDVWDFPKDGKCRLDPSWECYKKLMRK